MKKLKVRNEVFGKTIFNPNNFEHLFLTNNEFDNLHHGEDFTLFDNIPYMENKYILYSPIRVYIDLTLLCNLRCVTCVNNSANALTDELSIQDFISVLDGLKKDSVFDIRFTGGELTFRKDWDKILEKAKDLDFTFSINTNGVFNDKTIDKLIKIMPDEITVSLDGYAQTNDIIRGKGVFNTAISSIKKLKNNNCRVTINCALTKYCTNQDIDSLLNFANDFCDDISFFHARPIGRASNLKTDLLNFYELSNIMGLIESKKNLYPNLKVRTRSSSLKSNSITSKNAETYNLQQGGTDGFTRFNIMSNGDLYAGGCVPYVSDSFKESLKLGNIIKEEYSLLNIWRNSEKLTEVRAYSSKLQERCNSCSEYKKNCHGFTMEMEYYRQNSKLNKNPFCIY